MTEEGESFTSGCARNDIKHSSVSFSPQEASDTLE